MHVEPSICPICKKGFDPLRSRALIVSAGRVRAFCSETCRAAAENGVDATAVLESAFSNSPIRPARWGYALALSAVCAVVALALRMERGHVTSAVKSAEASMAPAFTVADALKILEASAEVPDGGTAPALPERDLWMHPLAGPVRRMPIRNTRRFGAPRDGLRPDACRSGHCGIDIGEVKGEVVFAAHDGVVERVVDDDTGNEGRYVRLNHRGGTLTTSYMHLDSVRAGIHPGVPVKAGDPLGTVGDTGVFHSGPHLHFQIGVRAHPGDTELFIDPEPLLHLWVLRPPLDERPARRLARSPRSGPQGM
jgi:hypothetical protein